MAFLRTGDGGNGNDRVLAWTNANPTSSFGAQNVNSLVPLSDYTGMEVIYRISTSTERYMSTGHVPLVAAQLQQVAYRNIFRSVTADIANNRFSITDAYSVTTYGGTSTTTDNAAAIPVYIYLYK